MISLPIFSQRIFIVAAVSLASLVLAGMFVIQGHAQPLANRTTSASPQSSENKATSATQKVPMLEVHIANNGLVLLRGARVISVSGNTIHLGMTWGSSDVTWAALTHYNTKFLTSDGQKETMADISVGDIVTVTGTLSASGVEPIVNADFVRE
ncbi:MAG: hypothetical protein Q7S75_01175 [bacterium]|nr:hypothetical protein [bacterium]